MLLLFVGGYDFSPNMDASSVLWTMPTFPKTICLALLPGEISSVQFCPPAAVSEPFCAMTAGERILSLSGTKFHIKVLEPGGQQLAIVLPVDQLLDIRVASTLRFWRILSGKADIRKNILPLTQRKRLQLTLRALDGRQQGACYRDIAAVLFGLGDAGGSAWKSHDLRDRTIRLVRLGTEMMNGGYRHLLLYPYRRKLPRDGGTAH